MRITVKLFATAREAGGRDQEILETPDGTTVAEAREVLRSHFPSLAGILADCAVAVNRAFATGDKVLQDGDELAILPPVSGG